MTTRAAIVERTLPDIFYEDPERIEDDMQQAPTILHLLSMLTVWFKDKNVFVAAGGFIFWNRLNGNDRVSPDGFITLDTDPEFVYGFPNYLVWEVGKAPDFVMEVASKSTASNDLGYKRDLYAWLGIAEYWRFDSSGEKLYPTELMGERLVNGEYVPYELNEESDGSVWSHSEVLGLDFVWTGFSFDIREPLTGLSIDTAEVAERAERAAERAERAAEHAERAAERAEEALTQEQARAELAERERTRAVFRAQRAESERTLADRRADLAEGAAERERQARLDLEERLRKLLEERGDDDF